MDMDRQEQVKAQILEQEYYHIHDLIEPAQIFQPEDTDKIYLIYDQFHEELKTSADNDIQDVKEAFDDVMDGDFEIITRFAKTAPVHQIEDAQKLRPDRDALAEGVKMVIQILEVDPDTLDWETRKYCEEKGII